MSNITFKPTLKKGSLRRDNTVPVYIRVYFKGACRWVSTNLVCHYPEDVTRSFGIKNSTILQKASELVNYMRGITSELNVFALEQMTLDDVVSYIKANGAEDVKTITEYRRREVTNDPVITSIENITDGMTPCYVYLMLDHNTRLYKIGISSKPYFREKTLQGQQPKISLLFAKQFPTRKIALILERVLHEAYKEFHTRGEWYRLHDSAVDEIKAVLS